MAKAMTTRLASTMVTKKPLVSLAAIRGSTASMRTAPSRKPAQSGIWRPENRAMGCKWNSAFSTQTEFHVMMFMKASALLMMQPQTIMPGASNMGMNSSPSTMIG